MSNLAYKEDILLSKPPQYTCNVGKEAVTLYKNQRNEVDYKDIQIIHTVPKMNDIDREKNKKAVSNELYEIFLRIQSHLYSDNENIKY